MRHGRRPVPRWWPWLGLFIVARSGHPAGHRLFPSGQGGGRGRLLLLQRRRTPRQRARLHQPLPVHPHGAHHVVQSADFPPLFIFALAIPSVVGLKSFLWRWCGAAFWAPRPSGSAATPVGKSAGAGGAHRRLPPGRLPEYLDDRRVGAVGGAGAPAGRHAVPLRLPVLERPGRQGGGSGSGLSSASPCWGGTSSRSSGRLPPRPAGAPGPGAQLEAALCRPRDRPFGHRPRRGPLGRLQPEPVPKAGLHLDRTRCDARLGRLLAHVLRPGRGLLVDALCAGHLPQPVVQGAPEGGASSAQGDEYQHLALDYVRSHERADC